MSLILSRSKFYLVLFCLTFFLIVSNRGFAAGPPNDSCGGATSIVISNGGFGLGMFTGPNTDLTQATLQVGETFAPSIIVAGLNKKSVWYKFTLPTTRAARISLAQPGSGIQAGNVGFAVYKSNACVPGNAEISTKFSPIEIFGSSFHPCVESGDYLVQVTSNLNANGPVFITVDLAEPPPALYDKPADAYQFADINTNTHTLHDFLVQCQSIDNAAEICLPNGSFKDFSKSTWHTFTTPAYFDYFNVMLADVSNSGNSILPKYTVGYRLYEGNSRTTPVASLIMQGGCDSFRTNGFYYDYKMYRCGDLKPNTTYTVQLLYHKDHNKTMRIAVAWNGLAPTIAPQPIANIPTPNNIGVLPTNSTNGITTTLNDNFGCNSRHSLYSCPKSMPVNGVVSNGYGYKLSTFYSFKLITSTTATFYAVGGCGSYLMRLYKQSLTNNCNDLDTANVIGSFLNTQTFSCLDSGEYVLQIMGRDTLQKVDNYYYGNFGTGTGGICFSTSDLGRNISLQITAKTEVATNKFSLSATGKFDKINTNGAGVMQPLQRGITYTAQPDTLGCRNTVLPDDDLCQPGTSNIYTKASYREFVVADSFIISVPSYLSTASASKIFKGDLNALATSQSAFTYPQRITGVQPVSGCFSGYSTTLNACVTPGTYTIANFDNRLGYAVTTQFTILKPTSKFNTPAKAQDMGDIWQAIDPIYNVVVSAVDTFTCYDNPLIIDGVIPCNGGWSVPATKQLYRQFYLSKPAIVSIYNSFNYVSFTGSYTLFYGKATDGVAQLKKVGTKWTCFTDVSSSQCEALPAGWYTVVSYGVGPNYSNPLPGNQFNIQYSEAGRQNAFYIRLTVACPQPKFNRPHKASIDTLTGQPYKLEWGPQTGHTPAYPVTGKRYTLNVENFDCSQDTTFIKTYMQQCAPENVKVSFYVFRLTQESYVQIGALPYDFVVSMYNFDVRGNDSTRLKTDTALQPCLTNGKVSEFCKLQPGIYTLVYYGSAAYSASCMTITPTVYVDKLGTSRFDHANNAYDFGAIIPDSTWRDRKPGDVNPLDPNRAPSNDFFYCTTGAQPLDPDLAACMSKYNPNIYKAGNNITLHPDNTTAPDQSVIDRRNLWYTFTVDHPGKIRIAVRNMTIGKNNSSTHQYPFTVFKSDVNGTLPFTQVIANGLVDSTLLQGLSLVGKNWGMYTYCAGTPEIEVLVPPCSFTPTRYYIMVENRNPYGYDNIHSMNPNSQVEVSLLLDSINAKPPKFDHYYQANDLGLVNSGIKKGEVDNFTCATKDLTDPLNYSYYSTACSKTLWYKFTTNVTGKIRYGVFIKTYFQYYYDQIGLYQQIKPGDSTLNGLQLLAPTRRIDQNDGFFGERCITPGTYYILLPGCGAVDEDVYPQIEIIPQEGDFCSTPMVTSLTGPGNKVVPVTVDCHTIGTDYGEFNPKLTCPAGAVTTSYKTSWYRLDITGTDTLDVSVFINEKTNAGSTDIKYRMMTGTCGAMQEQSCVQDALTRNTYKCLAPGNSYYIQVFSPIVYNGVPVTGDIDLNISALLHADTCLPASTCIGVANFTPQFDCTKDKDVVFTNFSTYGSSIKYEWDFGYNNEKSNAVSPRFFYPALTTAETYTVKLVLTNMLCGKKDSVIQTIAIPARPSVNLGPDTIICTNGATIALNAKSHNGSTYNWYNGSTQPSITAGGLNYNTWVEVAYGACKARDTIAVLVNPIAKKELETKALCNVTQVTLNDSRGQGEQYQWSTGAITSSITASQPGYFWCDLYWNGCIVRDSFQVVSTSLRPLGNDTTLCQAQMPLTLDATVSGVTSYSWQNSTSGSKLNITKAGLYWVDINLGGCTFRDSINVLVDSFKISTIKARICQGQNYFLPSGKMITKAGVFKDSLKNSRGCDSIVTTLTLAVDSVKTSNINTVICTGQNYILPSGRLVNATGNFNDTVKNKNGCDSIITNLSISVAAVARINHSSIICAGSNYILPSGKSVSATGIYIDTVKAKAGCDSLVITENLAVLSPVIITAKAVVCSGNSYTLPSGVIINASGIYRDTLHYSNGCDSLVRSIAISIDPKPALGADKFISTCPNNLINLDIQYNITGLNTNWTLNGAAFNNTNAVSIAGTYRLIATNAGGCTDTAFIILTIDQKPNIGGDKSVAICVGETFDLTAQYTTIGFATSWIKGAVPVTNPQAIFTAGDYQLIVTNTAGCTDTAVVNVTVNAKPILGQDITLSVCPASFANLNTAYDITGLITTWTSGATTIPNVTAVEAGLYQLIAINKFGCADTAVITVSNYLNPALGNDQLVNTCQGTPASLTGLFNTSGLSSKWFFNGNTVNDPSAVLAEGVYQLVVTNSTGCMDTALATLTINLKPNLEADKIITLCAGSTADLTILYNTTGLTAKWFKAGLPVSAPASITTTGLYQLIVTNASNCTDTANVSVTFNPTPILGPDKTTAACAGNSISLIAQYSTSGFITNWTLNGTPVQTPAVITTAGLYQVIVNNNFSCADTAVVTVTINSNPNILITAPTAVCTPATADLTAASITTGSTASLTYTYWNNPAASIPLPAADAATNGVFYIKGTDANGCYNIKPVNVVVYSKPVAFAGRDTTICDQSFALLRGSAGNLSAGNVIYAWSPPTGLSNINAATTMATPGRTATYFLTATVNYGPCALSATDDIRIIMQQPVPAFAGNDTIAVAGVPQQLRASGGTSYSWFPAARLNNPFISNPLATIQQDTRFTVRVTDIAGCVATDTIYIKVYNGITYYVPNAFSPNGDGLNDIFRPVPAGVVSTEWFRVYSRYGQLVFETAQWMKGWDGTYRGIKQPLGNYIWVIKGLGQNGKLIEMRGNVVLIR